MKKQKEIRWVITFDSAGKRELYVGQWLTRKDAIREHTHFNGKQYRTWAYCRKQGDRAIKATIIF